MSHAGGFGCQNTRVRSGLLLALSCCFASGCLTARDELDAGSDSGVDAGADAGAVDSGVTLTQVEFIMLTNCSTEHGCHYGAGSYGAECYFDGGTPGFGANGLDTDGVVDLTKAVNVPSVYSPKLRVKPFEPDASFLMDKLTGHLTACEGITMPRGSMLPPEQIALIREWITEGAQLK
jgi:hypothetical protein